MCFLVVLQSFSNEFVCATWCKGWKWLAEGKFTETHFWGGTAHICKASAMVRSPSRKAVLNWLRWSVGKLVPPTAHWPPIQWSYWEGAAALTCSPLITLEADFPQCVWYLRYFSELFFLLVHLFIGKPTSHPLPKGYFPHPTSEVSPVVSPLSTCHPRFLLGALHSFLNISQHQ